MKIATCEHPKRVFNRYTKEWVYTHCGQCPECLRHKASEWTERLTQERYCWKYNVFFTLTYAPEFRPHLQLERSDFLFDLSHVHYHPEKGDICFNVRDYLWEKGFSSDIIQENIDWIKKRKGLDYLSVGDAQRFIKRLRIQSHRLLKNLFKQYNENGIKKKFEPSSHGFRYYLMGEYGETTTEPHYHGLLFFNSEELASHIEELISSCWKFGITNSSFVTESNASYVAGYVNCSANLPQVLLHPRVRPFAIFSKCPPIGTLCHSSQEIKKMFFECSPEFTIFNHSKSAFANVPLWKTYQRALYPKISGFSDLSHSDRVNLYRVFERVEQIIGDDASLMHFLDYLGKRHSFRNCYLPSLYVQYGKKLLDRIGYSYDYSVDELLKHKDLINPLVSWYYTSMRVCRQAQSFDIPVRMYVSIIERFYANCDKYKLKNQYDYEEELSNERNDLDSAFALDLEFVRTMCLLELSDLDVTDIVRLQSFGIDVEKFYDDDLKERDFYRLSFLPDTCNEMVNLRKDSHSWLKKHMKTKLKNDYLMAHPELQDTLWISSNKNII